MTVLVGLAPGDRVPSAVNLGAMLARSADLPLVVTAVVPEPWPPNPFRSDDQYLTLQSSAVEQALAEAAKQVGHAAEYVLRRGRSVASGLLDVAQEQHATYIVLGSSDAGALHRVALGGVADRMLYSSGVPLAIAPRGFTFRPACRLSRVTVAFGRDDSDSDLLAAAADRAAAAGAELRVACYAVRPPPPAAGLAPASTETADELIVDQWAAHLRPAIKEALSTTHRHVSPDSVQIVVGQGASWSDALHDMTWKDDEILVVGTSTSPLGRLFLGSHAAKIVRNSPVPVMLVPRSIIAAPSEND